MVKIYIFRRDLRLDDNIGLNYALSQALTDELLLLFIFDTNQLSHKYLNHNAIIFMFECLIELSNRININFITGEPSKVIDELISKDKNITEVIVTNDISPYSKLRDKKINDLCSKHNIKFTQIIDNGCLTDYSYTKPYVIYGAYKKYILEQKWITSTAIDKKSLDKISTKKLHDTINIRKIYDETKKNANKDITGGIDNAFIHLGRYCSINPSLQNSSRLSAYLNFGCITGRQIYEYMKLVKYKYIDKFIESLIWRDFYIQVAYNHHNEFKLENDNRGWVDKWIDNKSSKKLFEDWCNGNTGIKIVDAAMKQLVSTGFMPNRLRMITAYYLVRDCKVNWTLGRDFFAQYLIDVNYAQNTFNWGWITGPNIWHMSRIDSWRTFNYNNQQKKYDPDGSYIKKYLNSK